MLIVRVLKIAESIIKPRKYTLSDYDFEIQYLKSEITSECKYCWY